MKIKTWLVFFCVQIVGIAAMHLGPDWSLVLGITMLLPGLLGLYLFTGIHKLTLIRDARLALLAVVLNGAVWQVMALSIRRFKKHS
ncbi:MAG TPA: hypothetical protein VGG04_05625 [Candidatus Sulfotelmatobacter sp.]